MTLSQLFYALDPGSPSCFQVNELSRYPRWVWHNGIWVEHKKGPMSVPLHTCYRKEAILQRWAIMRELPRRSGSAFWTVWRPSRKNRVQIGIFVCTPKAIIDYEDTGVPAWYTEAVEDDRHVIRVKAKPLTIWERLG